MILDDARDTTRQTFEFLFDTASAEQHELLVALERYVDMLHNIIDDRQQVGAIHEYPDTKRSEVWNAHRQGHSTRQIEAMTGVGKSTVSRWIRQIT